MSSYDQSLRGGERERDRDRDRSRTDRDGRQPVGRPELAVYERSAQRAGADQGEQRSREQDPSRSRLRSTAQMVHDDGRGSIYNGNSGASMQSLPPPPSHGGAEGRHFPSPPAPMHGAAYQSAGASGSREGRFEQAGSSRPAVGSNLNSVPLGTRGSYHQEQVPSISTKSHHYSPDNYAGGGRAAGAVQQDRSTAEKYSSRDAPSYLMPSPYTSGAPSAQMSDRLGRREYPRDQPAPSTYEQRQMEARQMDSNGRDGGSRQPDRRERERSPVRGSGYAGPAPVHSNMSSIPVRERDRISQVEADMWQSRNSGFSRPGEGGGYPRSERVDRDGGDERGRGGFESRQEARPMDPRQQQGGDSRLRPVQGAPPSREDMQAARAPRDPTRASAAALAVAAQWQGSSGGSFPPPPPPARRDTMASDDRRRGAGNAPLLVPFTLGGSAVGRAPLAPNGGMRSSLGGSSYQSRTAERALERDREPRVRDERLGREPRIRSPVRNGPRAAPDRVRAPFNESHPLLLADVATATRELESYLSTPVVSHIRALLVRLARVLDISTIQCSVWGPLREIQDDVLQIAATERLAGVSWYTIKKPNAMIASVMRTAAENAIRYGTVDEHQAKVMFGRQQAERLNKEAARGGNLAPERRRSSVVTDAPTSRPRDGDVRPSSRLSERELARMGGGNGGSTRDRRSTDEDVIGTACYGVDAAAKPAAEKADAATTDADMEEENELADMEDPLRDMETAEEGLGLDGDLEDEEAEGEVGAGQAGDRYNSSRTQQQQQASGGGGEMEEGDGGSPVSQGHSRSRSSSRTRSRSRSRSTSHTRSKSAATDAMDAMDTATAASEEGPSLHDASAVKQETAAATTAGIENTSEPALEKDFIALSVDAHVKVEDNSIRSGTAAITAAIEAVLAPTPMAAPTYFSLNSSATNTAPPPPKAARKALAKRAANTGLSVSEASLLQSSSGPGPLAVAPAVATISAAVNAPLISSAQAPDVEVPRRGRHPPIIFDPPPAAPDSIPLSPPSTAAAAKGRKGNMAAATKAAAAALLSTPSTDAHTNGTDLTPAGAAADPSPSSEEAVPFGSTGSGGRGRGKRAKPEDEDVGTTTTASKGSERAVAPAQRGRKRK